ncbi:MAG: RagB/SusD family nutrient uptake outer membrane protein [Mucilaginibacter sp.]|nr:RagB/SusD family nutrient uptake outer membrane protein [Mucilaginibacter sp.]
MKIKSYKILKVGLIAIALQCAAGCKRDFLKPRPAFYL